MGLDTLLAVVMLAALIAYAVLAGADFGAGVWDLASRGPRAAAHRRALAAAIGPVWEANHVWLIFLVVVMFTCFPPAYAAASVALFWPLHAILAGIVLRGTAFVFRAYGSPAEATQAWWGHVFGASSAVTPLLLGMCLGAVSTGAITADGSSPVVAWVRPLPISMGVLALTLCAYLAAVYLAWETVDEELRRDFTRRATWCWFVAGAMSALTLALTYVEARHLWGGLTRGRGALFVATGAALAPMSLWALRTARLGFARVVGAAQVTVLLLGWGVAQWPYLIYPDVTVANAAAPAPTLRMVAFALPLGLALLAPSLWFLFAVFKSPRRTVPD